MAIAIANLATDDIISETWVDAVQKGYNYGLASDRPTAGTGYKGMMFYATDTGVLSLCDGTGWMIMREPEQTWTPTWWNLTIGNGVQAARYQRSGGMCDFSLRLTFGSTTTMGTAPYFGMPVSTLNSHEHERHAVLFYDATGNRYGGETYYVSGNQVGLLYHLSSGSAPVAMAVPTATAPYTWAVNDYLVVAGRFRMDTPYS